MSVRSGAPAEDLDPFVTLVVIACTLSLLFLGHLAGVREGTVAAALLVGQAARRMNRVLEPVNRRLLSGLRDR